MEKLNQERGWIERRIIKKIYSLKTKDKENEFIVVMESGREKKIKFLAEFNVVNNELDGVISGLLYQASQTILGYLESFSKINNIKLSYTGLFC